MIVPVILNFCSWGTRNNNLAQYNALPYATKPVMDFKNQDMAWYLVEECLRLLIERGDQENQEEYFSNHLPPHVRELFKRIKSGQADA